MIISPAILVAMLLADVSCEFNGFSYQSLGYGITDCCEEAVQQEYAKFEESFGASFSAQHLKLEQEVQSCDLTWLIDASEYGWEFNLGKMYLIEYNSSPARCAYGLGKNNNGHFYHAYKDLARPEDLDALVKCACGEEYAFPDKSGLGLVACNGDYITTTGPRAEQKGFKTPQAIDVERRKIYCDVYPYYKRVESITGCNGLGPANPQAEAAVCIKDQGGCTLMGGHKADCWPLWVALLIFVRRWRQSDVQMGGLRR